MKTRIKICGITRLEDAKTAVNLGVDALGFIFVKKSPRYIKPSDAARIIKIVPPFVTCVGVFMNATASSVMETAFEAGVNCVQLHGIEPPETVRAIKLPVIKAFGIDDSFDPEILDEYDVSGFLLDTSFKGSTGGTGRTFDWTVASRVVRSGKYVILSGGLGPVNVEDAIREVEPCAVDLNSGVEVKPGIKNPHKMRDAVRIIRAI